MVYIKQRRFMLNDSILQRSSTRSLFGATAIHCLSATYYSITIKIFWSTVLHRTIYKHNITQRETTNQSVGYFN